LWYALAMANENFPSGKTATTTEDETATASRETALDKLITTVARLRGPGGCPWDRKQTHQSLAKYLIEESYETLEIIDQIDSPEKLKEPTLRTSFREELGDVLLQVLLHAEIAGETGAFDIQGVARALDEKLIRRHPHVFGNSPQTEPLSAKLDSAEAVEANWERIKAQERAAGKGLNTESVKPESATESGPPSVLDGLPRGLPALPRAERVIAKVTKVGFQWPDFSGPLAKLQEEVRELEAEVQAFEQRRATSSAAPDAQAEALRARAAAELGDVLFSIANMGFLLGIDPEQALRGTLARFESRFRHVERLLRQKGKTPEQSTLAEMDALWEQAKALERGESDGVKLD
jgi:tetrapyrrole methylase family protein/MazG family protein